MKVPPKFAFPRIVAVAEHRCALEVFPIILAPQFRFNIRALRVKFIILLALRSRQIGVLGHLDFKVGDFGKSWKSFWKGETTGKWESTYI